MWTTEMSAGDLSDPDSKSALLRLLCAEKRSSRGSCLLRPSVDQTGRMKRQLPRGRIRRVRWVRWARWVTRVSECAVTCGLGGREGVHVILSRDPFSEPTRPPFLALLARLEFIPPSQRNKETSTIRHLNIQYPPISISTPSSPSPSPIH